MQRLKGRRALVLVTVVVVIALVIGVALQRTVLAQPDPFQAKVNEFEAQGYSVQGATFLASTNLTIVSSNSTYAHILLTFPSNETADEMISVIPNQTYTPTQDELNNITNGIYEVKFTHDNNSSEWQYFVAETALSTASLSAAIMHGMIDLQSQTQLQISNPIKSALLNAGAGSGAVKGVLVDIHVLEHFYGILESVLGVAEALVTAHEYQQWVSQLNELQDCAEHPTNPVTINGYSQDPNQEQQILNAISNARSELKSLTEARFVNIAVSLGSELVGKLGLDVAAVLAGHYSEETLKQLSEDLMKSIVKMVTPCGTTTTSSISSITTQSLRTLTLSTFTPTGSAHADFYGSFQWTLSSGGGFASASGTFKITIDPITNSITGSGMGYVKDTLNDQVCTGSASTSYTFNIKGGFDPNSNNLTLITTDSPSPAYAVMTMTCNGLNEVQNWIFGSVQPGIVLIPAVDGGTATGSTSEITYSITLSTSPVTTTFSTISSSSTSSTSTSSETSTSTTESSSTTTSYTIRVSTSNSTSTGQ
jgi:hypothetical protein